MQRNILLISLVLFAALSASHCAWLVRTTAGKCGMTPYSVHAMNGNCVLSGGSYSYRKVSCDGSTATLYNCNSALCSSCQQAWTEPLNSCDGNGNTLQCFHSQPDLTKFVGSKYITDSVYLMGTCKGDPSDIYAYPRDKCVNIYGSASFSMSCQNGLAIYSGYNTSTCTGSPSQQFPSGALNQCALSHYQQCY